MSELKLNNLQKLAVNYLQSISQLNFVSSVSGNIVGCKMANHHIPLVRSILGPEIMEMLNNPVKAKNITRQAEDFYDLMVGEEETDETNWNFNPRQEE